MDYERYKPKFRRPFGMGPFFDFGVAMLKHFDARAARASARRKKSLAPALTPVPVQQGAEDPSAP